MYQDIKYEKEYFKNSSDLINEFIRVLQQVVARNSFNLDDEYETALYCNQSHLQYIKDVIKDEYIYTMKNSLSFYGFEIPIVDYNSDKFVLSIQESNNLYTTYTFDCVDDGYVVQMEIEVKE